MPPLIPDHIKVLLTKRQELHTQEEQHELHTWYDQLNNAVIPPPGEETAAMIWERLQAGITAEQPAVKPVRRLQPWMWLSAAAIAGLIFGMTGWRLFVKQEQRFDQQLITKAGMLTKVVLPDGSLVWLNAGSKLDYNKNWHDSKTREVILSGEAFFDVVKKDGQPFIIHTTLMDIRVLGTSFNVKAYPGDATAETALLTGKVAVVLKKNKGRTVLLQPNQKLVVPQSTATKATDDIHTVNTPGDNDTLAYHIGPVNIDRKDNVVMETSWREGKLAFSDQTFRDIATQLERWYGITVVFQEPALEKTRFTGTFREEPLARVMMALQLSAPFNYKIQQDTLMIYR